MESASWLAQCAYGEIPKIRRCSALDCANANINCSRWRFASKSKGEQRAEKMLVRETMNEQCHKSYSSIDFLIFTHKSTIFRPFEYTEGLKYENETIASELLTFLYAHCLRHRQTVGRYKSRTLTLSLFVPSFVHRTNFIFIRCRMDHSQRTRRKCTDYLHYY